MKYKNLLPIVFICNILIIYQNIVIFKNSESMNETFIDSQLIWNSFVFILTCIFIFIFTSYDEINNDKWEKLFYFNIGGIILIIYQNIVIFKNSESMNEIFIDSQLIWNSLVFILTCILIFIFNSYDNEVNDESNDESNNDKWKRIFYFNIGGIILFNFIEEMMIVLLTFLLLSVIYIVLYVFMFLFFNIDLTKKIETICENHFKIK